MIFIAVLIKCLAYTMNILVFAFDVDFAITHFKEERYYLFGLWLGAALISAGYIFKTMFYLN